MQTNLVVYLTSILGQTPASASVAVMVFEGTCYLTPLLGAYLADAAWGRYRTILTFSCIYFAGLVALALSTVIPGLAPSALRGGDPTQPVTPAQRLALYIPLYIVALGTGGIKPNVSAFGADQFDESDPADAADKKSFFNWFYLFVNVGSLLAVTTVVYVQDAVSWSVGFAIPAAAMAAAVGAFAAGAHRYRHVAPTESPMARVVRVLLAARKNAKAQSRAGGEAARAAAAATVSAARAAFSGPVNLPPSATPTTPTATLPRPPSYGWLSFAEAEYVPTSGSVAAGGFAGFSRAQVEEVRLVVRMAPVFWTTAFYWAIYAQMGSFFVEQGAAMDRWTPVPWGDGRGQGFTVPAASLALFNTVAIIALVPLYDRGLTPLLEKYGRKLTLLQRIGWGLVLCAAAMAAAAGVEATRLAAVRDGRIVRGTHGRVAAVSVYWQVPQYLLVGASEVLTSIGQVRERRGRGGRALCLHLCFFSPPHTPLARVLLRPSPRRHALLLHGPRPAVRGCRFLSLRRCGCSRRVGHHRRRLELWRRLAPLLPQQRPAGPFLLDDGGAGSGQHSAVCGGGVKLSVQNDRARPARTGATAVCATPSHQPPHPRHRPGVRVEEAAPEVGEGGGAISRRVRAERHLCAAVARAARAVSVREKILLFFRFFLFLVGVRGGACPLPPPAFCVQQPRRERDRLVVAKTKRRQSKNEKHIRAVLSSSVHTTRAPSASLHTHTHTHNMARDAATPPSGAGSAAASRGAAPGAAARGGGDTLRVDSLLDDVANAVRVWVERKRVVWEGREKEGAGARSGRMRAASARARPQHRAVVFCFSLTLPSPPSPQVNDYVADGFDAFDRCVRWWADEREREQNGDTCSSTDSRNPHHTTTTAASWTRCP